MNFRSIVEVSPLVQVASESLTDHNLPTACCVLDSLFEKPFGSLSFHEKQLIVDSDRPTPEISLSTKCSSYLRHLKVEYNTCAHCI